MKRLVLLAAGAVALTLPTAALAAESVSVGTGASSGMLTYISGTGTVDTVTLTGSTGGVIISETTSPTGSIGKNCSALGMTSASCTSVTTVSLQTLDLADSILNRSSLPGTLDGGAGDDTVTGGPAAETIRGGDGNDIVAGGGGADTVDAGQGSDQVDVRDGVVDTVDCGDGADTALADSGDVLSNCEVVNPVSAGTGTTDGQAPGGTTGSDPSSPVVDAPRLLTPVTVIGPVTANVAENSAVEVSKKGKAPFTLACAADAPSACTGLVFIDPVASKKGRKAKGSVRAFMARRGRFGASPFRVKPGNESTLSVQLTGLARNALGLPRGKRARMARRGRRVRAVVTVAPKNTRAQRVTIVLKG